MACAASACHPEPPDDGAKECRVSVKDKLVSITGASLPVDCGSSIARRALPDNRWEQA